jgi:hypothetical protein
MDARCAAECRDRQTAVVGERRQAARPRCRQRLEPGIGDEAVAVLDRLGEAEIAGAGHRDSVGCDEVGNLGDLAAIMAGDQQAVGNESAMRHAGA